MPFALYPIIDIFCFQVTMYLQLIIGSVILLLLIPASRPHFRYFFGYITYGTVVMVGSIVYGIVFYIRGEPRYENSWYVFPNS